LRTRIATTGSVSLSADEKLTAEPFGCGAW
jgi:hypothetical protein